MNRSEVEYEYLTKNTEFKEAARSLKGSEFIAIDLEFDRFRYRYGFNLCLMQIFNGDNCYLIDPVTNNGDLSPLYTLLEDDSIPKITFSFGEDLRLLHHLGCKPANVYDLGIAASLLDYGQMSLSNLLEEVLSIQLPKSSQQSNWFKRPLSDKQLKYAANDVLHLPDLYKALNETASETGIKDWIDQENQHFFSFNYEDEEHTPALKEKDKSNLNEVEWKIFSNLYEFVNEYAAKLNRPPYQIADKNVMRKLSQNPEELHIWKHSKRIHRKLKDTVAVDRLWNLLKESLKQAKEDGLSHNKKAKKKMSPDEYQIYQNEQREISQHKKKIYRPIQKYLAGKYGKNAQSFILNNRLIAELVAGNMDNLLPYKEELFREAANELQIELNWEDDR